MLSPDIGKEPKQKATHPSRETKQSESLLKEKLDRGWAAFCLLGESYKLFVTQILKLFSFAIIV